MFSLAFLLPTSLVLFFQRNVLMPPPPAISSTFVPRMWPLQRSCAESTAIYVMSVSLPKHSFIVDHNKIRRSKYTKALNFDYFCQVKIGFFLPLVLQSEII